MKLPKNIQILLIAVIFVLLVGLAPMALVSWNNDIDETETTAILTEESPFRYVYGLEPSSQYVSSGVTAGEQSSILNDDLGDGGTLSPGQYFGTTFDERYVGSFQYKLSNTFGQIEIYDGSSWNYHSGVSGTGLELVTINDDVQGVRLLAGGMAGTTFYHWGLDHPYDSSQNVVQTIDLAPEPYNRLSMNWTVYGGSASAEYSTDGTTWNSINQNEEAELDTAESLYIKMTLSGSYPSLDKINYQTSMYVPTTAPQSLTSTRNGKVVLENTIKQGTVRMGESQSNIFPFIQNFIDFFQNLIGGLNI